MSAHPLAFGFHIPHRSAKTPQSSGPEQAHQPPTDTAEKAAKIDLPAHLGPAALAAGTLSGERQGRIDRAVYKVGKYVVPVAVAALGVVQTWPAAKPYMPFVASPAKAASNAGAVTPGQTQAAKYSADVQAGAAVPMDFYNGEVDTPEGAIINPAVAEGTVDNNRGVTVGAYIFKKIVEDGKVRYEQHQVTSDEMIVPHGEGGIIHGEARRITDSGVVQVFSSDGNAWLDQSGLPADPGVISATHDTPQVQ